MGMGYNVLVILSGWKEIAQHLRCGLRTAQRWEGQGLPVKRVTRSSRSHVVADSEQLDAWMLHGNVFRHSRCARDLVANLQRAQELKTEIQRTRETLRLRLAELRKELAAIRTKRRRV